eukprot:186522-Amphidinium_carterae.1
MQLSPLPGSVPVSSVTVIRKICTTGKPAKPTSGNAPEMSQCESSKSGDRRKFFKANMPYDVSPLDIPGLAVRAKA